MIISLLYIFITLATGAVFTPAILVLFLVVDVAGIEAVSSLIE